MSQVNIGLAAFAAVAALVPMANAAYNETFDIYRFFIGLLGLNLVRITMVPRLLVTRELVLYAFLTLYMAVSLLWTPDPMTGLNTLVPAANFLLLMMLYSSLAYFHDVQSVLGGLLVGFLIGATAYTVNVGFPFVYPPDFSYNAVAAMYLFGFLLILLCLVYLRTRFLLVGLAILVLLHIAATTSIKTNLGILLGALMASVFFSGQILRLFMRYVPVLAILLVSFGYVLVTNASVYDRVVSGYERVANGVAIIQAGADAGGGTSFGLRQNWITVGLEGWRDNPLFGNGVEAFRSAHGTTSHSSAVDLLYNTGLIGFTAFYAILLSVGLRALTAGGRGVRGLQPLVFGGVICYAFITLSGTVFYQAFLAMFLGLGVSLLERGTRTRPLHRVDPSLASG